MNYSPQLQSVTVARIITKQSEKLNRSSHRIYINSYYLIPNIVKLAPRCLYHTCMFYCFIRKALLGLLFDSVTKKIYRDAIPETLVARLFR